MKAKTWTWGTNPDPGKYPSVHSLTHKETRPHNKRMATMSLGNSSYLWHFTRCREIHSGATYIIFLPCQLLTLLEQKGGYWLLEENMGKYQAILLDNPNVTIQTATTPILIGMLSPPAWLLRNHWRSLFQQTRSIEPASDRTQLNIRYRKEQLHGKCLVMSQIHGTHHRQGGRSSSPCHRSLSTKGWTDSPHQSFKIVLGKNVNFYTDFKYTFRVVHAHGQYRNKLAS